MKMSNRGRIKIAIMPDATMKGPYRSTRYASNDLNPGRITVIKAGTTKIRIKGPQIVEVVMPTSRLAVCFFSVIYFLAR